MAKFPKHTAAAGFKPAAARQPEVAKAAEVDNDDSWLDEEPVAAPVEEPVKVEIQVPVAAKTVEVPAYVETPAPVLSATVKVLSLHEGAIILPEGTLVKGHSLTMSRARAEEIGKAFKVHVVE